MRSEYKYVEVAPASTTILEFASRGGAAKPDKYIFEIIEDEETGTEIIVARLYNDRKDDTNPLRPKGRRQQALSPLFSDVDTSPSKSPY